MRWMKAPAEIQHHTPLRTCIATRTTQPATQLLRVVAQTREDGNTVVVPDPRRTLPGRGAWITPVRQAFSLAEKRRAFSRALKVPATADLSEVRTYIDSLAEQPASGLT